MDDDADVGLPPSATEAPAQPKARPQWLAWALASGAFAACNGVFAKLTTADRTQLIATEVARRLGLAEYETALEVVTRAIFFGLNLLSNAIMWILFTRALTAATSTTRVSILNTSANFMVTAVLGMLIFGEHLPLTWWLGAALLVTGSVIIGAREGQESDKVATSIDAADESDPPPQEPYRDMPGSAVAIEEPAELRR